MSTADVAEIARRAGRDEGVQFYFKEKFGFPDDISLCLNHDILNGIPRADRVLKPGDTLKISFGLHRDLKAFSTQTWTVQLGNVGSRASPLLLNGLDSLSDLMKRCVHGATVSSLARELRSAVSTRGDFLSDDFAGHIIGQEQILEPRIVERSALFGRDQVLPEGAIISLIALTHPSKPRTGLRDDRWTTYDMNPHRRHHGRRTRFRQECQHGDPDRQVGESRRLSCHRRRATVRTVVST